jgi:hypothetical protein
LYSAENLRLCVMTPSWPIMSLNQVSAKAGQNPTEVVRLRSQQYGACDRQVQDYLVF